MRHIDIVKNEWGAGFQECVGRITIDFNTRPDLEEKMLDSVIQGWHNSYLFVTNLHANEDCPFKESTRLNMGARKIPPGEEYKLSPLSKEDDA